jgi:sec-independent protein translocase protein TatA
MLNVPTYGALPLGIFNLQPMDVIIVLAALLLLFGGRKLPELARGLGRGMRLFKDELSGVSKKLDEDEPQQPADKDKLSDPNQQTPTT